MRKISAVPKEESDAPLVAWYDMITMGKREGLEEAEKMMASLKEGVVVATQ